MKYIIGLFILIAVTGCSSIDAVTGEKTSNFYSIDQDVQFGSEAQNETLTTLKERGVPLNADPVQVEMLQGMVNRITAVSDLPDLPYEVTLIHTNIVNAMAAPGGKIMVYEGLWDPEIGLARDEEEIAAVIAHEIAHVTARHSTEAMTRSMPVNMLASLGMMVTKDSQHGQIAEKLIAGGMFAYNGLWMSRYSRTDEKEADAVGMLYMAKAGYNPEAAIRIWERVSTHQEGADPADSIFSTHPSSDARVESLRAKLPEALAIYEAGLK